MFVDVSSVRIARARARGLEGNTWTCKSRRYALTWTRFLGRPETCTYRGARAPWLRIRNILVSLSSHPLEADARSVKIVARTGTTTRFARGNLPREPLTDDARKR